MLRRREIMCRERASRYRAPSRERGNRLMKRIRIIHKTEYHYKQPVKFGPHRAMMRPREGHDAHIARARVSVEPKAEVTWLRDAYDNSIAILTGDYLFACASKILAELGPEAVRIQAETFCRLVAGQINETIGPRSEERRVGKEC